MKTLILDYSIWRCGGDDSGNVHINAKNILGKGFTMLNNDSGYFCCLGQICLQIDKSLTRESILGVGDFTDECFGKEIKDLSIICRDDEYEGYTYTDNSILSSEAMSINDDNSTTPKEKIALLKPLFTKYGYELEVVNEPEPESEIPSEEIKEMVNSQELAFV